MRVSSIGVIGGGTVGRAIARCFMEWGDVSVYDTLPERSTHTFDHVMRSNLVFVCLPTPQRADGPSTDLAPLRRFFSAVAGSKSNMVLRSTVPVGTTSSFRDEYRLPNLIHSPEFLTARCANSDVQIPSRNIIGGIPCEALATTEKLYARRFTGTPLLVCSSDESELIKLVTNAFFAVKISFFTEMRSLSDYLNLNWDRVMAGVLSDGRIAHSHTRVPGPDSRYGFGGGCLAKDACSLLSTFDQIGLVNTVLAGAIERNAGDRRAEVGGEDDYVQAPRVGHKHGNGIQE